MAKPFMRAGEIVEPGAARAHVKRTEGLDSP